MMVAKNNEPFKICGGFSKIFSDLSPDWPRSMKPERPKLHKSQNVRRMIFDTEENKCAQCVFEKIILEGLFTILFLFFCVYPPVTKK